MPPPLARSPPPRGGGAPRWAGARLASALLQRSWWLKMREPRVSEGAEGPARSNWLQRARTAHMTRSEEDRALPRWTTDCVLVPPTGTPAVREDWTAHEANCSCVGHSMCLAAYRKAPP